MMQIGAVRVLVLDGLVTMHVSVLAAHGRIVRMRVVTVVVAMRVFVLERFVTVQMAMLFGGVKVHGEPERERRCDDQRRAIALARRERQHCSDERCHRKQ